MFLIWELRGPVQCQMDHSAAEPQPKAKPFNAEERSKQKKDEESQKLTTETRSYTEQPLYKHRINKVYLKEVKSKS